MHRSITVFCFLFLFPKWQLNICKLMDFRFHVYIRSCAIIQVKYYKNVYCYHKQTQLCELLGISASYWQTLHLLYFPQVCLTDKL